MFGFSFIEFEASGPMTLFTISGQVQFPISFNTFAVPSLLTLLIAALAVYSPARNAARMAPGDALRANA